MTTNHIITRVSLPDEIKSFVPENIELYIHENEYWDKFCAHETVKRGHKTFEYRRLIKPDVRPEDVKPMAETVAPRPTKFALATFTKTVDNYGANAEYTREDLQYHIDNTVALVSTTLRETIRQKLDIVKGKKFVSSRAILTYKTSVLDTLDEASIIFRKNEINRWANHRYLAHVTPEIFKKIKDELRARNSSLDERTKVNLNGVDVEFDTYGDWIFSIATSPVLYKHDGKQILVLQGKRAYDNESGVVVSKLEGEASIEFGDNGLGSGVIQDEDGQIVADKNKQLGSCYANALGVGCEISDDLAVLNCEIALEEINAPLDINLRSGFASVSPTSSMTIVAVDQTGKVVASPTLVVKEAKVGGATISATSGATYPVTPGVHYVITASKASHTTMNVKLVANAGNNTIYVLLPTAA